MFFGYTLNVPPNDTDPPRILALLCAGVPGLPAVGAIVVTFTAWMNGVIDVRR